MALQIWFCALFLTASFCLWWTVLNFFFFKLWLMLLEVYLRDFSSHSSKCCSREYLCLHLSASLGTTKPTLLYSFHAKSLEGICSSTLVIAGLWLEISSNSLKAWERMCLQYVSPTSSSAGKISSTSDVCKNSEPDLTPYPCLELRLCVLFLVHWSH